MEQNTPNLLSDDKYGIFDGFINKNFANDLISYLYFSKREITLFDFLGQTLTIQEYESIKNDRGTILNIALKYVLPLLKNGKLKVKIMKRLKKRDEIIAIINESTEINKKDFFQKQLEEKDFNGKYSVLITEKEYSNNEAEYAIDDIFKKWSIFETGQERINFEMNDVVFTLGENEWSY